MKSKKQIYLLYSCDTWKSKSSMILIMATTSKMKMQRFIANEISSVRVTYDGENRKVKDAVAQFKKDWDSLPRGDINGKLDGLYVDYAYDGEEI